MPPPSTSALQTEFAFVLPKGYVDSQGNLHREGRIRLATALDEIAPLRDPRARENPAYVAVLLMARVVTRLGTLAEVNTNTIENLFAGDLAYLQDLYRQINGNGEPGRTVTCPRCQEVFPAGDGDPPAGESRATPSSNSSRR
jgi:hypothetical protein